MGAKDVNMGAEGINRKKSKKLRGDEKEARAPLPSPPCEEPATPEPPAKKRKLRKSDEQPEAVKKDRSVVVDKSGEEEATKKEAVEKLEEAKLFKVLDHTVRVTGLAADDSTFAPAETFDSVKGFSKKVIKICSKKFEKPTPIQAASWPLVLAGLDVVGIAKTGSGKTLAFTLPFLAKSELGELDTFEQPSWCPRMLVLAPTRELAQQTGTVIEEFVKALAPKETTIRYPVVTFVGGVSKREQKEQVARQGADIACCTPGRLTDLVEEGSLDLSHCQLFVLDEADRMLDLGFIDAVKGIAGKLPKNHQTVLFSATWPRSVDHLARSLTRKGKVAKVSVSKAAKPGQESDEEAAALEASEGSLKANDKIKQSVEVLKEPWNKLPRLLQILNEPKRKNSKVLIFGLYKKEVATLERSLQQKGFPDARAIQGDMSQEARYKVMDAFKSGKLRICVATDVASRGLDVPDIDLVVNYTFPLTIEDFVHRVGRTGRAEKTGEAITLFNAGRIEGVQDEKQHAGDLVRVLREAGQAVNPELENIAGTSQGNKATKKKAHPIYGNHFKDEDEMAKLELKKVHTTFDDSDDE